MHEFLNEVNFAVSVCDENGKIIYLNKKGAETFRKDGGMELIGSNILDCHPEPSKTELRNMLFDVHKTQSIMKGEGEKRRVIHQTPIYKEGEFSGYIEMIIPMR